MGFLVEDSEIECEKQHDKSDEPYIGPNLEVGGLGNGEEVRKRIEDHGEMCGRGKTPGSHFKQLECLDEIPLHFEIRPQSENFPGSCQPKGQPG